MAATGGSAVVGCAGWVVHLSASSDGSGLCARLYRWGGGDAAGRESDPPAASGGAKRPRPDEAGGTSTGAGGAAAKRTKAADGEARAADPSAGPELSAAGSEAVPLGAGRLAAHSAVVDLATGRPVVALLVLRAPDRAELLSLDPEAGAATVVAAVRGDSASWPETHLVDGPGACWVCPARCQLFVLLSGGAGRCSLSRAEVLPGARVLAAGPREGGPGVQVLLAEGSALRVAETAGAAAAPGLLGGSGLATGPPDHVPAQVAAPPVAAALWGRSRCWLAHRDGRVALFGSVRRDWPALPSSPTSPRRAAGGHLVASACLGRDLLALFSPLPGVLAASFGGSAEWPGATTVFSVALAPSAGGWAGGDGDAVPGCPCPALCSLCGSALSPASPSSGPVRGAGVSLIPLWSLCGPCVGVAPASVSPAWWLRSNVLTSCLLPESPGRRLLAVGSGARRAGVWDGRLGCRLLALQPDESARGVGRPSSSSAAAAAAMTTTTTTATAAVATETEAAPGPVLRGSTTHAAALEAAMRRRVLDGRLARERAAVLLQSKTGTLLRGQLLLLLGRPAAATASASAGDLVDLIEPPSATSPDPRPGIARARALLSVAPARPLRQLSVPAGGRGGGGAVADDGVAAVESVELRWDGSVWRATVVVGPRGDSPAARGGRSWWWVEAAVAEDHPGPLLCGASAETRLVSESVALCSRFSVGQPGPGARPWWRPVRAVLWLCCRVDGAGPSATVRRVVACAELPPWPLVGSAGPVVRWVSARPPPSAVSGGEGPYGFEALVRTPGGSSHMARLSDSLAGKTPPPAPFCSARVGPDGRTATFATPQGGRVRVSPGPFQVLLAGSADSPAAVAGLLCALLASLPQAAEGGAGSEILRDPQVASLARDVARCIVAECEGTARFLREFLAGVGGRWQAALAGDPSALKGLTGEWSKFLLGQALAAQRDLDAAVGALVGRLAW